MAHVRLIGGHVRPCGTFKAIWGTCKDYVALTELFGGHVRPCGTCKAIWGTCEAMWHMQSYLGDM